MKAVIHSSDIATALEKHLHPDLASLLRQAGEMAAQQGCSIFLVGGVVRDLLLGRPSSDMDLVVAGNAIKVARRLAREIGGQVTTHPSFGTAKLRRCQWSLDLATARSETYSRPGALPTVEPGTIMADLARRDFTVNAMALDLTPEHYGQLLDPHNGRQDLEQGLIRVLHERSFMDDATRIFRAIRYEQRLGFRMEPATEAWLRRDLSMLNTVSGDRVRHELELVLQEAQPEKMLCRAHKLGVLAALNPSLKADDWLAAKFAEVRHTPSSAAQPGTLYLCLLLYCLTLEEADALIDYLNFPSSVSRVLKGCLELRERLATLAQPDPKPSDIYSLLHKYPAEAIKANALAQGPGLVQGRLRLYWERLRHIKASLNGSDLQQMGVAPGPRLGRLLAALHKARLDGEVNSRDEEIALVRAWLQGGGRSGSIPRA